VTRKIANALPWYLEMKKLNDNEYALNTCYHVYTHVQKFVPGVEIEQTSPDGRTVKNIFTIDGNKLIEKQIESKREVTVIREFTATAMTGLVSVNSISTLLELKAFD